MGLFFTKPSFALLASPLARRGDDRGALGCCPASGSLSVVELQSGRTAMRRLVHKYSAAIFLRNERLAWPAQARISIGRFCQIASYDGKRGYNFKWQVADRIGSFLQHAMKRLS